ncbi:hypothetical protein FACS1894133_6440 [Clostridia bacterium]|nr:hypothetical protein FACS1894133_6440 [Clostridia bacterium]
MLTTEFNIDVAKRVWVEDGELKKALQVAKNMLKRGFDPLTVAECTNLDYDTVQRLADSQ